MRALARLYRDAYRGISREVWVLSAVLLVNRTGTMVLPFLVLYLTTVRGMEEAAAGLTLTAWGVGAVLGIALGGRLTDRVGFRAVQSGSLLLAGVGFLLLGTLPADARLYAGAFALGCIAESFRPANQAAVAAYARPERRTQAFGLNRLGANLGWSIGPALGGFLAARDFRWLFWVDGGTCLLAGVAVLLFLPPRAAGPIPRPAPGGGPWRDLAFLAVFGAVVLQALVFFQLNGAYPLFLHEIRGLDLETVGLLLAFNGVLIVLFEMPLIEAVRGRPPLAVAAVASLAVGAGFGLTSLASGVAALALLVGVWTLGEMLSAPTISAWVANRAPDDRRGSYLAAYGIAYSLCFAAAPALGLWLYGAAGPGAVWAACGASGALSAAALALVTRREAR